MAYPQQTYTSEDLDDIVIDFIGTYAVQFVTFASLIALAVLFVWFKKKGTGKIM